ncbi:MAG TPA: hypothetical protein ACFE0H_06865 [Elainellaceae cyanobacterium]
MNELKYDLIKRIARWSAKRHIKRLAREMTTRYLATKRPENE